MKMNQVAGVVLAGLCVLGATNVYAEDSVAVMKIDAASAKADKAASALLESIRAQVKDSQYILDANGSDITYTEMQMVTGCDREGSIACYDAACETLGSKAIIFGNVQDNGDAHIIWYISGKGIFREAKATLSDKTAVDKLAREIVIGEVGHVIVTSNIPGADVFIDGKLVGMSAEYEENAQPIELVTGNYVIAVRKDGFTKEDAVTVNIKGGETSHVHVDMNVMKDPEEIRNAIKISGFTSLGVGVAGLVAAGVLGGLVKWKYPGEFEDYLLKYDGVGSIDPKYSDDGKYSDMALSASVLFGVGGFFAAAGIALIVTAYVYDFEGEDVDKAYSNKYMPKIDVSLTPDYQGMAFGWSF